MERKLVYAVLLLFFLAAVSQALTITTRDGNGADGWISNDNQSSSYYSNTVHNTTGMQARYNGGGSRFRTTFIRFDISSVTGTIGADAQLQLGQTFTKGGAKTMHVYGLVDGDAGEFWSEATLCYDNAPGFLTPPEGNNLGYYAIDSRLVLLGTFIIPAAPDGTPSGGATLSTPRLILTDPTTLPLADFLNADTNGVVTLVLINEAGTSANNSENRFASKEDPTDWAAPALVFVPEPATLALAGLGSLITLRRRHR
jgi:hypothetical protein